VGDVLQFRRQRSGADAEAVVEAMLRASEVAGLGRLRKRHVRVIKRGGELTYCAPSGCDYHGHLRGGRAVYLEVKHTTEPRFALKNIRSAQVEELDRAADDGCVAVVLVLFGPAPHVAVAYALPWWFLRAVLDSGARSVLRDALDAWRVPGSTPLLAARGFAEG
jgi:hypothetical protein